MSSFEINGQLPPGNDCYPRSPVEGGSYTRLVLPEPVGLSGEGVPVGAAGYPYYEVYFDILPMLGWEWYASFVGSATSVALTSLVLYNPWSGDYETCSAARMHRPTYERQVWGDAAMEGVRVLFTNLVFS